MGTTEERVDTADHRPDVYYEPTADGGETRVYRASSFGNCEQNLVRQALGHTAGDAPEWMLEKYKESAGLEDQILDALADQYGWRAMRPAELPQYEVDASGQFALELPVSGGVVRCHPDAIAKCYRLDGVMSGKELPWQLGDRRVVEVKALSAKSSPFDLSKYPYYVWQFSIEMAVTRLPGIFVVAWKDEDGELVVENGKPRLSIGWYSEPPKTLLDIKKRAGRLGQLIRDAEEGKGIPPCDVKQFPCGFWAEHDGGVWGEAEVPETDDAALLHLAEQCAVEKERMEFAKEMYDKLRADLLARMAELGLEETVMAGDVKVTRVRKAGRVTYDYRAMKDAGLEIGGYAKTGKASEYVTVEVVEP